MDLKGICASFFFCLHLIPACLNFLIIKLNSMSDDRLEDYIICLTLTVICSWVVQLVVVEFLFSQEHNLFHEGLMITKSMSSEGMAVVLIHLQEVYMFRGNITFVSMSRDD
jgi:hypothetical protein